MTSDTRQCYFPSGARAPNNVPCKSDTNTHCCGRSDICLDNGLCLNVGHQPYVLSRGACTNKNWNGCSPICKNATPSIGASITNVGFSSGEAATYCCGSPRTNGSSVVCLTSESDSNSNVPFTIQDGSPILGAAMLQNVTTLDTTDSSSSDSNSSTATPTTCPPSHDVAIGAGVGVPLGAIAILLLIWALLERRKASRALQSHPAAFGGGYSVSGHATAAAPYMNITEMNAHPPVELEHTQPVSELMAKDARR
ncbi:hypothetical protein AARAC_001443 [Aspergillus arachidicola]|uniref:Mid2 domain-containing protein n=1 Tax=Aspergillus arachidicola TaxID=656916 RepID=A0A2G7FH24_9EURO|nr:hypothetical protein AARAC_001443 [Aspergillus arachidicola]